MMNTTLSSLPLWIAIPVALLLVLSGIVTLTGSLGLLRLPTFYTRIHAPTMGNTLGVFFLLLTSIVLSSYREHSLIVHPLLITILLVITSPVTAVLLMRAAIRRKVKSDQRQAGTGSSDQPPRSGS